MNNQVYSTFQLAKKNRDLKTMERLYLANKSDIYIKFEYAKLLNRFGRKKEAYKLFKTLSFDNCYAMFELGKLEFEFGNIDEARSIFNKLINTKTGMYALFELGKLEAFCGNVNYARKCFKDILKQKKEVKLCRETFFI